MVIPPTHSHMSKSAAGDLSLKRSLQARMPMKASPWALWHMRALITDPWFREVNNKILSFSVKLQGRETIATAGIVKVYSFPIEHLEASLCYKLCVMCIVCFS